MGGAGRGTNFNLKLGSDSGVLRTIPRDHPPNPPPSWRREQETRVLEFGSKEARVT